MKTKTIAVCEDCEVPIEQLGDGLVVQGFIFAVTLNPAGRALGGLIGTGNHSDMQLHDVPQQAWCWPCFHRACGRTGEVDE